MWFARRLAGSESVWVVLVTGKSLIGFSLFVFFTVSIFFGGFLGQGFGSKKKARGIMLAGWLYLGDVSMMDGLSNEKRIYVMGNIG